MKNELIEDYAQRIQPILEIAKKAYGSRSQDTPEHKASREYTRLLAEFQNLGGSLPLLAKRLNVQYSGVRRRVVMNNVSVSAVKPKIRLKGDAIIESVVRVRSAKEKGTDEYHDQLADEYRLGISLANLAKELGLSSAAPLYYGVQKSIQRNS
jgi:hypothetical protein